MEKPPPPPKKAGSLLSTWWDVLDRNSLQRIGVFRIPSKRFKQGKQYTCLDLSFYPSVGTIDLINISGLSQQFGISFPREVAWHDNFIVHCTKLLKQQGFIQFLIFDICAGLQDINEDSLPTPMDFRKRLEGCLQRQGLRWETNAASNVIKAFIQQKCLKITLLYRSVDLEDDTVAQLLAEYLPAFEVKHVVDQLRRLPCLIGYAQKVSKMNIAAQLRRVRAEFNMG
ncbi:hypothetical protein TWF481_002929 [Arthrobotrys musiformis]|uniref:Uncharacterized protein n=1 Tax=Arthrobotrys musiformis TaxID=47236 RepID=A0AAV9VTV1_9PEZI